MDDHEYRDKTAFKEKLFERVYNIRSGTDIKKVGRSKRNSIISALNASLRKHKQIIFYQTYRIKLDKVNSEGENVTTTAYLHSTNRRIFDNSEVGDEYDESVNEVDTRLGQYMGEASGWILDVVENVHLSISAYKAIRGSS